jgi:glycine dehydrogenase
MIEIRKEVDDIVSGNQPKDNNLLKNAPHPPHVIALPDAEWSRYVDVLSVYWQMLTFMVSPYSRYTAAYPVSNLLERKFWPTVSRIDDGMFRGLTCRQPAD